MTDPGRAAYVRAAAAMVDATARAGEDLLGKAQRYAPVEEGTLRGSGALALIVNGVRYEGVGARGAAAQAARAAAQAGERVRVQFEVSFNTVYAARQHEELGWEHPKGGSAKYLERPFLAEAGRYSDIINLAAKRSLGAT